MQNRILPQADAYAKKRKRRSLWQKIVGSLACVVVFVTTYMLILPAITMEQAAWCGIEEHQHGDSCYEMQLVCGYDELSNDGHIHTDDCYDEEQVLICNQEESAGQEAHAHTDDCYEKVLICQLEEHEHSLACYSNPEADLESAGLWERSVSGVELTGIWADDIVSIAQTQLGYEESIQNYIVTEDGEMKGITRYGQWYGDPYGDWSGMFASFCLNYAQIPASAVPRGEYCQDWISALSDCGLYRAAGSCSPLRGDIVFLDQDYDGCAERSPLLKEIITMLSRKYPSVRMPRKLSATVCWQSIPTSSPLTRMPWQRMTALCRRRKILAILQNLSMFPTT